MSGANSTVGKGMIQLEKRRDGEQIELATKSAQLRAVEALLLSKLRNSKPTPLSHLDILLEYSHTQASFSRSP